MDLIFNPQLVGSRPQKDEIGELILVQFQTFLEQFSSTEDNEDSGKAQTRNLDSQVVDDELDPSKDYLVKLDLMRQSDRTTLHVNFQHVVNFDEELAMAIESQFYRFEPFLKKAIQNTVRKFFPNSDESTNREFWISFYNTSLIFKFFLSFFFSNSFSDYET